MANWQVISLDTTTPQLRAPGTGDGYSFNSGSTQLGVWTTTGLGIGTASPAAKLHVVGNAYRQNDSSNSYGFTISTTSGTTTLATLFGGSSFAIQTAGSGTNQLFLDASGNLGLGVTPSAWSFTGVSLDLAGNGSLFGGSSLRTAGVYVGSNVYYTASGDAFRYKVSGQQATMYESAVGKHVWSTAASGTAGNTISFTQAMTLTASGNFLVGTTSEDTNYRFRVFGSGGSGGRSALIGGPDTNTSTGSTGPHLMVYNSSNTTNNYTKIAFGNYTTNECASVNCQTTDQANAYGDLAFVTRGSGGYGERARITSGGDVGIGTSSPNSKFEVQASAGEISRFSTSAGYRLHIYANASGSAGSGIQSQNSDLRLSAFDSATNIRFFTGNGSTETERARIDSSGNLLVGTTSNAGYGGSVISKSAGDVNPFAVLNPATTNPYGIAISFTGAAPNDATRTFLSCADTAATRATIRSNGGLANYQANDVNLSDQRVKKDVKPLGSMWDKFKAIEIVTFKYNDQTHDDDNIGVIAQQVESVAPEFIDVDGFGETPEDGAPLKTVYTTDMYHAAIKALQEAMARIEKLEAEVAALKGA